MIANKSQKDLFSVRYIKKDVLKCRLLQLGLPAPEGLFISRRHSEIYFFFPFFTAENRC